MRNSTHLKNFLKNLFFSNAYALEGFEVDETREFLADVIGGCDAGY
jgi:hypothetical protein